MKNEKLLSNFHSTLNFQLSTFNFQLSTFNFQLSTFNFQLSTFNIATLKIKHYECIT